jgi:hypothetical protein
MKTKTKTKQGMGPFVLRAGAGADVRWFPSWFFPVAQELLVACLCVSWFMGSWPAVFVF